LLDGPGQTGDVLVLAQPVVGRRLEDDARGRELLGRAPRQYLTLDALDRQRQPAALGVDLEHLDPDRVARLADLARVLDVVLSELGDVDEPLDAVEDLDERAERDDLRLRALELV